MASRRSAMVDYDDDDGYDNEEDDYELVDAVYYDVCDAVGDDFTEDEVVDAIRECNYDAKKAISFLLYGTHPDSKPPKKANNTPAAKPAPAKPPPQTSKGGMVATLPPSKDTSMAATTNKAVAGGKVISALARDLCTPVETSVPQLNAHPSDSSTEITPFSFSEPSPDDKVKEKQKQAFSKKPDKPRKDEIHGASHADEDGDSSATQKGTGFKYKQNVKQKALAGDMKNLSISGSSTPTSTTTTGTATTSTPTQPPQNSAVKIHNAARRKSLELKIKTYFDDKSNKDHLNMVVIGHVDAGKSTTMGHLLFKLGCVDAKTIHKYEKESQQKGKSSFHFAWVLDEHETERNRGVTINVGIRAFETDHHKITLLDAPGHRANMISGCAQADVAILMLDASLGSFENGFLGDGQTKEHAMLARSLGVTQLIVAVNKLDMVEWDNARFEFIVTTMTPFLKQAGFNPSNVAYVPCSGLTGENLVKVTDPKLTKWYSGPTLIERIDMFKPADRLVDKPLRMTITDVYKPGQGAPAGVIVAGKIETGFVAIHDKVALSPNNHVCTVKTLSKNHEWGVAGDNVELGLSGVELNEDLTSIDIVSDPSFKVGVSSKLRGQVVVFGGLRVPITPGTPVSFHTQSNEVAGKVVSLVALVDKATGEQVKARPRFLTEGQAALIDVQLETSVCIERYKDFRSLARFMLRDHGKTIAAGVVMDLL